MSKSNQAEQRPAIIGHALPWEPPQSETTAIINLIDRASRDVSVDLDKMQRLIEMRSQIKAAAAEEAFDVAMAEAQAEMRAVAADSNNPQTKSKYASYFALDKALRPIYTKHKFSLSFDTGEGAPEQCVRVLCRVSRAGHSRTYHIDMPADGKGAKGGDVMTKTHATGSAVSYGSRYLLKMIFNVAVGEGDDDGNAAADTADRITQEQADTLREVIEASNAPRDKFLKWARIARIEDLRAEFYESALAAVQKYGAKS